MPKKNIKGLENLALITHIGIIMIVPILLGLYIGKWLDEYFNTLPIFLLLFIIMGVIASFLNLFKTTEKDFGNKKRK